MPLPLPALVLLPPAAGAAPAPGRMHSCCCGCPSRCWSLRCDCALHHAPQCQARCCRWLQHGRRSYRCLLLPARHGVWSQRCLRLLPLLVCCRAWQLLRLRWAAQKVLGCIRAADQVDVKCCRRRRPARQLLGGRAESARQVNSVRMGTPESGAESLLRVC